MTDMLDFFVQIFGRWFVWLSGLVLVPGVSMLGFFGGLTLITVIIRSLLLRAK